VEGKKGRGERVDRATRLCFIKNGEGVGIERLVGRGHVDYVHVHIHVLYVGLAVLEMKETRERTGNKRNEIKQRRNI
jgi:hypothetical protein